MDTFLDNLINFITDHPFWDLVIVASLLLVFFILLVLIGMYTSSKADEKRELQDLLDQQLVRTHAFMAELEGNLTDRKP